MFALLLLYVGILMATSTRGAFISLFIGALYMLFVIRKDLNIVRLTYVVVVTVALFGFTEVFVSKYTISGGMIKRLMATKFVKGYIPENRAATWPQALERAKKHIYIGHSPVWDYSRKLEKWVWPHNAYLFYLNITGLFGLIAFLMLLYKLLRVSIRTRADTLFAPSFPRALMLILHVDLVMFMIDQIKIDYPRNTTYLYFVWFMFGLIVATHNVIQNESGTIDAHEDVVHAQS
jgi:O-antigen ligase